MPNTETKSIKEMSSKELEKLLKEKQKKERKAQARKQESYENDRNTIVAAMIGDAKELQKHMIKSKTFFMQSLEVFKLKAVEYADIRKDSKGGFSLRSSDGKQKVVYKRNVKFEYDERAKQAEELIKDFLADKVKKRDLKSYKIIVGLMERNKAGDYTPALISRLQKQKNTYDDERWIKALQLFEESFNEVEVSYSVEFFEKDENSKDQPIKLTFSTLPLLQENKNLIVNNKDSKTNKSNGTADL